MDNITTLIVENKTWLLIVLAIGGSIWGIVASGADKMVEERKLHKAPTDRMFEFRVYVAFSTLMFVVPSLVSLGFTLYAVSQTNITLLPAVLLGVALLVFCRLIFQYGVHVFKLCTWSIPSQRKIDLHQKGIHYFHEGDYENAMKCFLSSCKFHGIGLFAGWATSECYIGRMFFEGKGVKKDYKTAVKWFRKATELLCFGPGLKISDPNACEWMGYCYEHGYGVEEDLDVALHWYKEAADVYKKHDDGRFENVKKRWEELSGESYDESDPDEDDEDEEVDDDETEIEYEEEEDCEGEETDDEDECSNEDDDGETDEDDKDGLNPMEELNGLIGLDSVKKNVEELESFLRLQEERQELGLPTTDMSHHCVFTGNPGTGKTVVARIIARIYYDMGIIESDKLVETDRSGLIGQYRGESAQKTNEIVDSALDGVLFIDEAHNLVSGDDDDYGKEAVATLMKRMEDDRDRLVVIVAGYPDEMRHFLDADPGLKRRFSRTIHFSDYSADELTQIFFKFVNDDEYVCPSNTKEAVVSTIRAMVEFKGKNFGNAGEIRNLYQETIRRMSQRIVNAKRRSRKLLQTILPEDLPPRTIASPDAVESILEELDSMVGLKSVKEEIRRLVKTVKARKARERAGLKTPGSSYHCVFTGNPGTGKTTVARVIARIYHALGILATDKFVETDRSKLVAEYIGQTAPKTNDVIDSALDGVLFIDEAYTLAGKRETDFGQEAIDTLLKRMEDDRKRLVVIVAGYTNKIKQFIEANAGLRSRFTRYIDFQDYSADELLRIFMSIVNRSQYFCGDEAKNLVAEWMNDAVVHRGKGFGNGRFARSCFEKVIELQAERLFHIKSPTRKQLKELTASDIKAARYSAEA